MTTGLLVLDGTVKRYDMSVFGGQTDSQNIIHLTSTHFLSRWWFTVRSQASSRHFCVGCGWTRTRGTGWLRGSCMRWSLSGRKNRRVGGLKQIENTIYWFIFQNKHLELSLNKLFFPSRVPMVPLDLDIGCERGRDRCPGVSADLWREGQVWWDQTGKQLRQFWAGPAG